MRTWKSKLAVLALPLLIAACGGGGGGGDDSTTTGNDQQGDNLPASSTAAISSVPLAGNLIADCNAQGVGVVDDIIDAVNGIGALPVALPKLSEVVAMADLSTLPVIGGIVVDGLGQLESMSAEDIIDLIPGGVPGLADLDVPAQLPVICASLVAALPPGALDDPAALLALLGDPTHILGLIPIFDDSMNPVGVLLTTVPGGLVPGGMPGTGLPGVSTLPDLTQLTALNLMTLPLVGPQLAGMTGNMLGLLDLGNLLGGGLLALLGGLLP